MDWQDAIFAPGWVWSMVSMVLVVGSLLGLYRQLRLQADGNVREQLDAFSREWESERLLLAQRDVLRKVHDGVALEDLDGASVWIISRFWEKVGALCRRGHANPRLLLEAVAGNEAPLWWAGLAPSTMKYRADRGAPSADENFEWLADQISVLMARQGNNTDYASYWTKRHIDRRLRTVIDMILVERELRSSDPAELAKVALPDPDDAGQAGAVSRQAPRSSPRTPGALPGSGPRPPRRRA